MRRWRCFILILLVSMGPVLAAAQTGEVTGVHDPSVIQSGDSFYIFSTGRGIPIRRSADLFNWKRAGRVFDQAPEWTHAFNLRGNSIWAPDISRCDGEYRLYYAVSSFGKTASAIGLAVTKSVDPASPDCKWIDRGKVIETPERSDWNAIDPCAFEDADGKAWMVLGSCWRGLKLVELDRQTGLLANPAAQPISVAAHPPTNIIEEGYIRRRGDFYYLWESVDHCCRGIASDYRILVGRSKDVRGPYRDRDGRPMTEGGGTLVLASYGKVRGPGSCAIVDLGGKSFLVHHMYDADNAGTPTLQIRQLFWAGDGWPVVGEPIRRPLLQPGAPGERVAATKSVVPISASGDWSIRYDFGEAHIIELNPDGTMDGGNWKLERSTLTLNRVKAAKTQKEECTLGDDGWFFVGRTPDGVVISAVREHPQ